MRQSDNIADLAAALAKAQAKIEGAAKEAVNPHFRNKYADLGNVWAAIREPLTSNGLSVVQLLRGVERGVECETILMHATGQFIAESLFMPANKSDAQGYGSAATYARRYSLQAMVGIAPVDDDGEGARDKSGVDQREPPPKPAARPANVERDRHFGNAADEIRSGQNGIPGNKPAANGQRDPKAWAASDDAGEFLRAAKADLSTVQTGEGFSRWMADFRWEHDAIMEYGDGKKNARGLTRTDFLNGLISETQDRCRANALPADGLRGAA